MSQSRIFVSAVTHELRSSREIVARTLRRMGLEAVSEEEFRTGYGELGRWLREEIKTCEGVIQIVGRGYGAEPPFPDPEFGRVSYTQFEFHYAKKLGKKTWIITTGDQFERDTPTEKLDLPNDPSNCDLAQWQAERRRWQTEYLEGIRLENHLRHHAENKVELENVIFRIQTARITTEKIRAHLLQTVEETYHRENGAADQAITWKERKSLKEAATAAHAWRLGRIEDLASSFAEIEGRGTATNVFKEMSRILSEEGVDEAIAYVAAESPAILVRIRARIDATRSQNRNDLEPLLQVAALNENKGQHEAARAGYQEILAIEPTWPNALERYFWLLVNRGDEARIRSTQVQARFEYKEAEEIAKKLAAGDPSNSAWQRDLTVSFIKLGDVAVAQGKLEEAARAFGDGLAIRKKLAAGDPSNSAWQRDLWVSFFKLASLSEKQGRPDEAKRRYMSAFEVLSAMDRSGIHISPDGRAFLEQLRQMVTAVD